MKPKQSLVVLQYRCGDEVTNGNMFMIGPVTITALEDVKFAFARMLAKPEIVNILRIHIINVITLED